MRETDILAQVVLLEVRSEFDSTLMQWYTGGLQFAFLDGGRVLQITVKAPVEDYFSYRDMGDESDGVRES